ncbi:sensor histidine kinase [Undibacterium pigrum]|uniref:Histidine kinase n=1 Tax=Undibacterium pigrum TaxID=401470 RepID=A0A318JED7_9BURK|nr:sensor histidine kinase [Undibacterium pigrum]PXX45153.1 histidine kinase [Undibacterium pigrum]
MENARPDTPALNQVPQLTAIIVFKLLLSNILVWTSLCAIGALGNYADLIKYGTTQRSFSEILWFWVSSHLLMMVFSTCLYLIFMRHEKFLSKAKGIALAYMIMLLGFLPLEIIYIAILDLLKEKRSFGLQDIVTMAFNMRNFTIFLEYAWSTGTFIAVLAICTWRQARVREQVLQQSMNDVLHLRLDLEQQRLDALRGQLEPHFIFNCLNAISALVRADDKRIALTGLNRLSDLLRYALTASSKDWVRLEDEMTFIRDYLELQRLRYGARLQISIAGDTANVLAGDCPPLLLQPLLENALRHDLDCHEGSSDIRMQFKLDDEELSISVSNTVTDGIGANPGLGLGLPQTRARLDLIYAGRASMHSGRIQEDGQQRFEVQIRMPLHMPENAIS